MSYRGAAFGAEAVGAAFPIPPHLRRQVEQHGFSLEVQQAGLMALARPEPIPGWHRMPESIAVIAPVIGLLVQLARELGGSPAKPCPTASS
jgi:hypothetical protein